jgi:hypothetical protein
MAGEMLMEINDGVRQRADVCAVKKENIINPKLNKNGFT